MAVICFADGGVGRVGRIAANLVATQLISKGESTALYDCWGQGHPGEANALFKEPMGIASQRQLSSRQFIDDLRRLRALHHHLVVDVSDATDQTTALAFSFADLTLIPLRPSSVDISLVTKTIELLEILSNHRRRSLHRAVFLVDDPATLGPSTHLQISGLLIRRGLKTLPVCLNDQSAADHLASRHRDRALMDIADPESTVTAQPDINAFVDCVLECLFENNAGAKRNEMIVSGDYNSVS